MATTEDLITSINASEITTEFPPSETTETEDYEEMMNVPEDEYR